MTLTSVKQMYIKYILKGKMLLELRLVKPVQTPHALIKC